MEALENVISDTRFTNSEIGLSNRGTVGVRIIGRKKFGDDGCRGTLRSAEEGEEDIQPV